MDVRCTGGGRWPIRDRRMRSSYIFISGGEGREGGTVMYIYSCKASL